MNIKIFWVWWHVCVHRLDLDLYSHPKEFLGNGVRAHVNLKGQSPLPEKLSPEEDKTHDTALSRAGSPTHYQRAIPAPIPWSEVHHYPIISETKLFCFKKYQSQDRNKRVIANSRQKRRNRTKRKRPRTLTWLPGQEGFLISVFAVPHCSGMLGKNNEI